jgi:hypothetical protein
MFLFSFYPQASGVGETHSLVPTIVQVRGYEERAKGPDKGAFKSMLLVTSHTPQEGRRTVLNVLKLIV